MRKALLTFCRLLLGAVFVFSGFTKGVDPLGTMYKLEDYFSAFHLNVLAPYALVLSIVLNGAEFLMGIALLTGVWMRFTAWMALLFMTFFTVLTFVLALYNPVSDCGCFGDAVVLTNWQTFFKNLVIIVPAIVVFIHRRSFESSLTPAGNLMVVLITAMAFLYFSLYCYRHLPLIDFRPYKTGTYLPDQMILPPGAPRDSFQTVLYYKKDGVVKEFTLENIPWQDTTWKWVETKNKLIKAGYKPPIHDFTIESTQEGDITSRVLADTGFSFLAVIPKYEKADSAGLKKIEAVYRWCRNTEKCKFYALSASEHEKAEAYKKRYGLTFENYITDEIPLKTIVRSNPGLVLLKEGTVMGQWSYEDIPVLDEHTHSLYGLALNTLRKKSETTATMTAFLLLAFLLSIVFVRYRK